jgi:hypothetical protein
MKYWASRVFPEQDSSILNKDSTEPQEESKETLQGNVPSCMAKIYLPLMQGSILLLDPWKNLREELSRRLWF